MRPRVCHAVRRSNRDVLLVHPRDDPATPKQGVFSTWSSDRPNPIGLHRVQILDIDGAVRVKRQRHQMWRTAWR